MENIIGKNIISPYAVINGEIIAATLWEGDDTYEYEDKDWYKNAVEANGEVVYSNVYSDAITNKYIYTISKELEEEGNVIAIDIYINSSFMNNALYTLPESSSVYISDKNNNLIYAYSYTGENIYSISEYVSKSLE